MSANKAYITIKGINQQAASLSTLTDVFTEETLNTSLWTSFNDADSSAITTDDGLVVDTTATVDSTTAGIWSNTIYNLIDSDITINVVDVSESILTYGDKTTAGIILNTAKPNIDVTTGTAITFYISEGNLAGSYYINGDRTTEFSIAYDSSTMQWLQIIESDGVVYFNTSPDGSMWTTQGSFADPFNITALYAGLAAIDAGGDVTGSITFTSLNSGASPANGTAVIYVTAIIITCDGAIVASPGVNLPEVIPVVFSYGASNQDIRAAIWAAVQSAADDVTLNVNLVTD